jgi:hypothetical protein
VRQRVLSEKLSNKRRGKGGLRCLGKKGGLRGAGCRKLDAGCRMRGCESRGAAGRPNYRCNK